MEALKMYQHSNPRTAVTARTGGCGSSLKSLRAIAAQRRREYLWAWASLLLLLVCWDANLRLDQTVSVPRPRLNHLVELEQEPRIRIERH
jgi:hypothetical protein